MRKVLAVAAALLLVAAPIAAQTGGEPPVGTIAVYVLQYDGQDIVPVGEPIIVLPPSCMPEGVY